MKKRCNPIPRVFIRCRRSENSPAKFRSFSERALLSAHNNSPATLHYSAATTILNENLEFLILSVKLKEEFLKATHKNNMDFKNCSNSFIS